MQRVTAEPGGSGASLRGIRQKLQASRGQAKGGLAGAGLQQASLARGPFELQAEEERAICDLAVQHLREGASIVIDWTTRSNFRVRNELPKLRTEPIELAMAKSASPSIASKRLQLAQLLHERNKKYYLKSKLEQAEEARLFGIDHKMSLRNSYLQRAEKKLRRSKDRKGSAARTIESAQSHILEHCRLTELKGELKQKFQEIRELYNKKFERRERHSLGNA